MRFDYSVWVGGWFLLRLSMAPEVKDIVPALVGLPLPSGNGGSRDGDQGQGGDCAPGGGES